MKAPIKQAELGSCPEHQRVWRDRFVDKNLKDEWLEQLNNLKTLNLISICEGHPGHPRHYRPRMNLRIKNDLLEHMADEWQKLKPTLSMALDRCFPWEDTSPSIELLRKIQRHDKDSSPDDDIILYVNSKILRDTDWPTELTNNWFERAIADVAVFDESLKSIVFTGIIHGSQSL